MMPFIPLTEEQKAIIIENSIAMMRGPFPSLVPTLVQDLSTGAIPIYGEGGMGRTIICPLEDRRFDNLIVD